MPDLMRDAIERAQEQGLARLLEAGVTERAFLDASRRIVGISLAHLRLYDALYREVEAYVAQPGLGEHHRAYLQERGAHLLREAERGISAVVSEAISQVRGELQPPPSRPREVIKEISVQPKLSFKDDLVKLGKLLLWVIGIASLLFMVVDSLWWAALAIILPILFWEQYGEDGWLWWVIPVAAVGLLILVPVFHL